MIVTSRPVGPTSALAWVLMVTNAQRPDWPGDVYVASWREAGLKIPSKIRTEKISTVDISGLEPVGRADADVLASVRARIADFMR